MAGTIAEPFTGADGRPLVVDGVAVLVTRSTRRRRTVSARRDPGGIVVLLPAGLSRREELQWVERMARRVAGRRAKTSPRRGDAELERRAQVLASRYLDDVVGHPVRAASVRWVTNQNTRWGSCTVERREIRLSSRLQQMPDWVVDHVLLHELAHLVERNHTPRFHALVAAGASAEKAEGYLEGWLAAQHLSGDGFGDDATEVGGGAPGEDEGA